MNKNFDIAIQHVINMSAEGGLSGTYDNEVVSINFKVTENYDINIRDNDEYQLYFLTDMNASPGELRFKKSDVKEVRDYAKGEFEQAPFNDVVQIIFNDGSQIDFFQDYR